MSGGVTVLMEVKVVRNLFQLMERYEKYRQVCHLMENCDGHGGGEQGLGEVRQLSGSVTVIREV